MTAHMFVGKKILVGFARGQALCRLEAVDSSFWEISGSREFEAHILMEKFSLRNAAEITAYAV